MAEATVFVAGESEEPVVIPAEDLDVDLLTHLGPDPIEEGYSLGEFMRDAVGYGVQTYEVYSAYSMLAALWALQRIAEGHPEPSALAKDILGRVAISGDFEERAVESEESATLFTLPAVAEMPRGMGFEWAASAGDKNGVSSE